MTRALIPIAAGLAAAAAVMGVHWLAGGEFERGPELAVSVSIALLLGNGLRIRHDYRLVACLFQRRHHWS